MHAEYPLLRSIIRPAAASAQRPRRPRYRLAPDRCFTYEKQPKSFGRRAGRGTIAIPDTPPENNFSGGADTLVGLLYSELRAIARREHFRAGGGQTLRTTALISEAYIKLKRRDGWESESHFLGCAATAIRHILIDAARARLTSKRHALEYSFTESIDSPGAGVPEDRDVIRLGDALKALSELDPNLAQLIDCRFFAGLSEEETANVLGVTDRTVRRWWVQARAWIHHEMATA